MKPFPWLLLLAMLACASAVAADDDLSELDALLDDLPAEVSPEQESPPQESIVIEEQLDNASSSDPLAGIGQQMLEVRQRIDAGDTADETQFMQKQIVSDLDKLLAKLNKQCSCKNPSSQKKPPQQGKPGQAKPGSQPGQKSNRPNAQGSEEGIRQAEDAEETSADPREVVREAWGHLPQRLREQVQAAAFERFLPEYEAVIEAYYERLAEEEAAP